MMSSILSLSCSRKRQLGFSLIEMAIVLVILGFLLGGMITPLSSQREESQRQATERQLQEVRNALIGFAQINSRLPCPAQLGTNGIEDRVPLNPVKLTSGDCSTVNGFVPFQALGLQGPFVNGNLVDSWQRPLRYRVTNPPGANWAYAKQLLPIPTVNADFRICSRFTCTPAQIVANEIVAVVFSTGRDGADNPASVSPDQLKNLSGVSDFVMRSSTERERTNIEFDDILIWISRPTLIYELSKSGQ